ncbi:kinase-like domain-containing protein [Ochromonadaceae sp. CCMP2298]|nr:kinase-like domain-containing protein [Ochromonadaceae sp. CCMP2298]
MANFFQNTMQAVQAVAGEELKVGNYLVHVNRRLAEGGFGVVDLVTDIRSNQEFVLKRCNIDREESFETARKEINMLQQFKGTHVAELLDSAISEKNRSKEALLLMTFYPGDHLLGRLQARNGSHLPQDSILRIFGQLCEAVLSMHTARPPIVHRDLKLENVLFDVDVILRETTQTYRAPEMCDLYMRIQLTEKTDVWALGCVLYTMCFLIHPFQDGSSLAIINAKIAFPADSPFVEDVHDLILRMLDIDPECRPPVDELLSCIQSLVQGQPLPPPQLSQEALQCRADRLAAMQVRESKASTRASKNAPVKVVKVATAPSTNSVAAKRLAMMRGQAVADDDSPTISLSNLTSSLPAFSAAAAAAPPRPVTVFVPAPAIVRDGPAFSPKRNGGGGGGSFDPFADSNKAASGFDNFGTPPPQEPPTYLYAADPISPSSRFEPEFEATGSFEASTASTSIASFSPSAQGYQGQGQGQGRYEPQESYQNQSFLYPADGAEPAPAPAPSTVNFFDDEDDTPAPAPSPAGGFDAFASQPAPSPAGGFDAFASQPTTSPAGFDAFASQPAPAAAPFDPFGDSAPAPAPAAYNPFEDEPTPAPAPTAKPVLDLFGEAPAPAPAPANSFFGDDLLMPQEDEKKKTQAAQRNTSELLNMFDAPEPPKNGGGGMMGGAFAGMGGPGMGPGMGQQGMGMGNMGNMGQGNMGMPPAQFGYGQGAPAGQGQGQGRRPSSYTGAAATPDPFDTLFK